MLNLKITRLSGSLTLALSVIGLAAAGNDDDGVLHGFAAAYSQTAKAVTGSSMTTFSM